MKRTMKQMAAFASLAAFCGSLLTVLPANAEETIVKNFEYYQSLSDYEVYVEYCEMSGYEFGSTLPANRDMPDYDPLKYYIYGTNEALQFGLNCKTDVIAMWEELCQSPEMFGFPSDWYEFEIIEEHENGYMASERQVVDLVYAREYSGYVYCEIDVYPQMISYFASPDGETDYRDDVLDIYRIILVLRNSGFYKTYALSEDEILSISEFIPIGGADFGDSNADEKIDARDAAEILVYSAQLGTNPEGAPSIDYITADVTEDGAVNAKDAAMLLCYSAAAGSGYKGTLREYVDENIE